MYTAARRASELAKAERADEVIGTTDDGIVITRALLTKHDKGEISLDDLKAKTAELYAAELASVSG